MMGPLGDGSRREIPWQRNLEKRRSKAPGVEAGLLRERGGERPRVRLKRLRRGVPVKQSARPLVITPPSYLRSEHLPSSLSPSLFLLSGLLPGLLSGLLSVLQDFAPPFWFPISRLPRGSPAPRTGVSTSRLNQRELQFKPATRRVALRVLG
ncbi:hypothetical protein BDV11DRAFT_110901 [Aspergillus similis]